MTAMRLLSLCAGALLVVGQPALGQPAPGQSAPSTALARASLDPTLFREGEVRRRNETFGYWSLDCDEVPRLSQRFCSLRSFARDSRSTPVARVTVSTDEAGRPAALLDVPPSTDLTEPVLLTPAMPLILQGPSQAVLEDIQTRMGPRADLRGVAPQGVAKSDVLTAKLPVGVCQAQFCQTVWSLTPSDIAALRAGAGVRIRFKVVASSLGDLQSGALRATRIVDGIVPSDGFDDAIKSSVR